MDDGIVKTLVVTRQDGSVRDVARTNLKGFRKSLENGALWLVNPDTGRLLPADYEHRLEEISDAGDWYEARIVCGSEDAARRDEMPEQQAPVQSTAGPDVMYRLFSVVEQRRRDLPEGSYTTHLFKSGLSKIRKKTGEEAVELILAENREEIVYEAADLIYHMMVLLSASGIDINDVMKELAGRE